MLFWAQKSFKLANIDINFGAFLIMAHNLSDDIYADIIIDKFSSTK